MKTIITPPGGIPRMAWRELWAYRDLISMLAYRDIRVRYAQTWLGLLWALVNPLANIAILTFVFSRVANIKTPEDTPALLFTTIGLLGFQYSSEVFSRASDQLLAAQNLIKKVYFPRLIIPLSSALSALLDWVVALAVLLVLLFAYGVSPLLSWLYVPVWLLFSVILGASAGIWISALVVRFRDFRYVAPFLLRIGYFITPIGYAASVVPQPWYGWLYLNPLSGLAEWGRYVWLGIPCDGFWVTLSLAWGLLLFLGGIYLFKRLESTLADVL